MRRLHQDIEKMKVELNKDTQANKIKFDQELFNMILNGCSERELEQSIRTTLDGDTRAWHLTNLIPKVSMIQRESHRLFSLFQKQLTKPMDAQILRDLEFAMLAKIKDFRSLLEKAGLERREIRAVENLIDDWFDLDNPNELLVLSSTNISVSSLASTQILEQEVYILLKSRSEQASQLLLITPQHPNIAPTQHWKLPPYSLMCFKLPTDASNFQFWLGNQTKSQQFTNIRKQSYFVMQPTFENEAASKLQPTTLPEELCVISLLLGDGKKLVKFLDFLASDSEINRRNSAYFKLKLLKEGTEMRDIDSAFATAPATGKLLLCYCLASIIESIPVQLAHPFPNNLISKFVIGCNAADKVPEDARLAALDNSFRMVKMLADYSNNSGSQSSLLFNSLLVDGRKNLTKLSDLLEHDNIHGMRLQISREKLRILIEQQQNINQHAGYRFLLMLVVVFVGRCHCITKINATELIELALVLQKGAFKPTLHDDNHNLKARIKTQFGLIDALSVDWEQKCEFTKLKVLSELLAKMQAPYFELVFNHKLKKEMIAELSKLISSRHKESVELLAVLFVRPGNALLKLAQFESPFKELMAVKQEAPNTSIIPDKQLLRPFFLEVLYPLLLRYPVVGDLLKKISQTLAQNITSNKLKFDQMLSYLNDNFKLGPNDSRRLLTEGLKMLFDEISKKGHESAYNWIVLLTKGEWLDIFKYSSFLQDIVVDDLANRLKRERAAGRSAALEQGLENTFLSSKEVLFTPQRKHTLVLKLFDLGPPTKANLEVALFATPSRIRAYWLLAQVSNKSQTDDILNKASQIKEEINRERLNRKQLRNLVLNTNNDLWKILAKLFDRESPSLRLIAGNIEMTCQNFCLNLSKCVSFCQRYEQALPNTKPALKVYSDKLAALGEESSVHISFALQDITLRLYRCVTSSEVPLDTLIKFRIELKQQMTLAQLCDILEREIESFSRDSSRRCGGVAQRSA